MRSHLLWYNLLWYNRLWYNLLWYNLLWTLEKLINMLIKYSKHRIVNCSCNVFQIQTIKSLWQLILLLLPVLEWIWHGDRYKHLLWKFIQLWPGKISNEPYTHRTMHIYSNVLYIYICCKPDVKQTYVALGCCCCIGCDLLDNVVR